MASNPESRFKEQKTYETLQRDAEAAGLYDTFAKEDLDMAKQDVDYGYRLLANKQRYAASENDEDRASAVDQAAYDRTVTKQKLGGSGAAAETDSGSNAGSVLSILKAYDSTLPSDGKSRWMTAIDKLLGQIASDSFSYDAESDPRYALAQKYAKQAMQDQQASSAILTGGYGNSYGAAVGQQVYTDSMDDAAAELEQDAYNRWLTEREDKYNRLNLAMQLEQQDYNRAQAELERQREDEASAYSRQWNEEAREYERQQAALAAEAEAAEDARADALAKAQVLAEYGDFSGYSALGYTDKEIASMQKAYAAQTAAETAAAGKENSLTYAQAKAAYEDGIRTTAVLNTLRSYLGADFEPEGAEPTGTSDDTEYFYARNYLSEKGVADIWLEELTSPVEFAEKIKSYGSASETIDGRHVTFYDYDSYVDAFLSAYKGKNAEEKTVLSEGEFERRRSHGSVTIDGYPFDSYEAYLRYMGETE